MGRRCDDDSRQISRWSAICGPKGRWKSNLAAKVLAAGKSFDDPSVSPVVRQTLLHWAYELTAEDMATFSKKCSKSGVISAAYVKAVPMPAVPLDEVLTILIDTFYSFLKCISIFPMTSIQLKMLFVNHFLFSF